MNLVFLGPPGAGKGTQAVKVSERFGFPHISTGDMLRKATSEGSSLGLKAKGFMDKGDLVPDDVVIGIVVARIAEDDCRDGFILDGFPRTTPQAVELDKTLDSSGGKLDIVINIDVERVDLVGRLTGRKMCKGCGSSFHLIFNPPSREGVCDHCGKELYQRDDDGEESVINRLKIYDEQTRPLIEYYKKEDILRTVDGGRQIDEVFETIGRLLNDSKKDNVVS